MNIETDTKQVYKSKLEVRQVRFKTYVATYTAHNMFFETAEKETQQAALEDVMVMFVDWLKRNNESKP